MERILIVNADDFGLSEGVNRGILRAHQEGIVSSASLMVLQPAAEHAVSSRGDLDLGLHVDLAEWVFRNEQWQTVYQRVPLHDADKVQSEIYSQLKQFERLVGRLPSHLDSHQHVHRRPVIWKAISRLAAELNIPLRFARGGIGYLGSFYGQNNLGESLPQAISTQSLTSLIKGIPRGITELACHPGDDLELDSVYREERLTEVEALCDPQIRLALDGASVRLISFADLPKILSRPAVPSPRTLLN